MAEKQMFLTPNKYSRPKKLMAKIKAVVIHWYANPKSKAEANRNFFENRKLGKSGYGSAHYLLDDNDTIQALPDNEMAYHVGSNVYTQSALRNLGAYPNNCTIGIEMSHDDMTGKPSPTVYKKTVALTAKLLKENGLTEKNVWTHNQVVGWKDCHRWYTKNPAEWVKFIADVAQALNGKAVIISTPKPVKPSDLEVVEVLDLGDNGDKVRELQVTLNKLGYKLTVDGDFGPATDKAVEDFQRKNKLTVDGAVGPSTVASLAKAIENLYKPVPKQKVHTVVKGDTLWELAKKYDVTVEALEKANPRIKEKSMQIGWKVNIPAKVAASKPAPAPVKPAPKPAPAIRKFVRVYKYDNPLMTDKRYGSSDIAAIQNAVGTKPDGIFGHNTEIFVKNYQKRQGLKADGIVGPDTWNRMF